MGTGLKSGGTLLRIVLFSAGGVFVNCGFGVLDGLSGGRDPNSDASTDDAPVGAGDQTATGIGGAGGTGEVEASAGSAGQSGNSGAAGAGGMAQVDSGCPTCSTSLVLYWKFDEESGTTVVDSSSSGFNGLYTGTSGLPTPSGLVPPLKFLDPYSRAFSLSGQQAAWLAAAPPALKPRNDLSITLWYRATKVDTTGSEILSLGDTYFMRMQTTAMGLGIYWTKYSVVTGTTMSHYVPCFSAIPNALDGNWHHIAGVATSTGTTFYFDGAVKCTSLDGGDISYVKGADFWVARHGAGQPVYNFDGNIDELRIYSRPLTAVEVQSLAKGEGASP